MNLDPRLHLFGDRGEKKIKEQKSKCKIEEAGSAKHDGGGRRTDDGGRMTEENSHFLFMRLEFDGK